MATRWIVVDDLDAGIEYSPEGWFTVNQSFDNKGNFGPTYLGTLHGTNGTSSLSFPFEGSAIRVYGTNDLRNSSGVLDPTWDCLIDGTSIGPTNPFPYQENNWIFCDWKNGADGSHVLTLNAKSNGQTFWFDQIQYLPSPGAKISNPVVLVTQRDNAIKYDKDWRTLGSTANMTIKQGSSVSVEFVGTRLSWWGFIPSELPETATTGAFSIDGGPATNFALRGHQKDSPTIYFQMFFQTPVLPLGPHKIFVIYQGNGQTTPLTLTNLLIHDGNYTSPLSDDPSIFDTSDAPGSQPSDTQSANQGSNTPVGAIVGGVLGGVFLIAVTIFFLLFLYRRRKAQQERTREVNAEPYVGPMTSYSDDLASQQNGQNFHYQPVPTHHPRPSQTATDQMTYDPPSTLNHSSEPSPQGAYYYPQPIRKGHLPSRSDGSTVPSSPPNSSQDASTASRVLHHQDSGVRIPTEDTIVEVPPEYTPR